MDWLAVGWAIGLVGGMCQNMVLRLKLKCPQYDVSWSSERVGITGKNPSTRTTQTLNMGRSQCRGTQYKREECGLTPMFPIKVSI
jgi:hypothetical protein